MTQFKIGDKVRFRQDGEIGQHNKMYFEAVYDVNEEYVVLEVSKGMVAISIDDGYWVTPIQIELVPDPKPKFADIKVGDWVEHLNGTHLLVIEIRYSQLDKDRTPKFKCNNRNTYSAFDGSCICDNDKIVRILSPKEVVIDFGSGINGRIHKDYDLDENGNVRSIWVMGYCNDPIARIWLSHLDPQTRAKVEQLLKAQEEA